MTTPEDEAAERLIKIVWDGPHTLEDLIGSGLRRQDRDYGVYAIYGAHPLYGTDVLLYIGKASEQTFGARISQEGWEKEVDPDTTKVYLGRICGKKTSEDEPWRTEVALAERLLIYVHSPAYNANGIGSKPDVEGMRETRLFNYGKYRSLQPEASGLRWLEADPEPDATYRWIGD